MGVKSVKKRRWWRGVDRLQRGGKVTGRKIGGKERGKSTVEKETREGCLNVKLQPSHCT